MSIPTSISHGDLKVESDSSGTIQICRQSNGMAIQLSSSEWIFILKVADLLGWPAAPPSKQFVQEPFSPPY